MDHMLKAPDQATMDAALLKFGLLVVTLDENGADVTRTAARVSVTSYGGAIPPMIWDTKPVYDANGNLTTAGVQNPLYHANVRDLAGLSAGVDWAAEGVTLIDPTTVNSPAQSWG
jgi:hypothetical protein